MTIRAAMQADGAAGEELRDGELGHVCFRGPQTFLGYVNDPAATAAAIARDGYLYTGDMGFRDEKGLHLAGRAKLILKPSGYQVFPGDVENHFCALEGVAMCAAVGVPHPIISEAIVAFVETQAGSQAWAAATGAACARSRCLYAAVPLRAARSGADAVESRGQGRLHGAEANARCGK